MPCHLRSGPLNNIFSLRQKPIVQLVDNCPFNTLAFPCINSSLILTLYFYNFSFSKTFIADCCPQWIAERGNCTTPSDDFAVLLGWDGFEPELEGWRDSKIGSTRASKLVEAEHDVMQNQSTAGRKIHFRFRFKRDLFQGKIKILHQRNFVTT